MTAERTLRWGILGTANIATKVSRQFSRPPVANSPPSAAVIGKVQAWGDKHNVPILCGKLSGSH